MARNITRLKRKFRGSGAPQPRIVQTKKNSIVINSIIMLAIAALFLVIYFFG